MTMDGDVFLTLLYNRLIKTKRSNTNKTNNNKKQNKSLDMLEYIVNITRIIRWILGEMKCPCRKSQR